MSARRWYLLGFLLGAAGVLLAGEIGGPGWGVVAGSVWATMHAVVLVLPPARRPAQPPEVPGAESVRRVGVTR